MIRLHREQARSHRGFLVSWLLRPRRPPRVVESQQIAVAPQLAHLPPNPVRATQYIRAWACGAPYSGVEQDRRQQTGLLPGQCVGAHPKVMACRGFGAEHTLIPLDAVEVHLEAPLLGPDPFDQRGTPGLQPLPQPAPPRPQTPS